ncbi:hypothetical protein E5288_WYG021576 [Bos mutus]|uniref:Uncharacterized protein n=1 Tax=Bos mutus TaxID=72004 RepID=A0A6B0R3Z3_9CETA|nr:hypothetical protein [Bos mutus]
MPTSEVSAPFSIPNNVLSSPDSVSAPEQPLGRPLTPQLNDLFPWAFRCLPGPYREMFRYQKAVWGYIHREIRRHKLRTSEAPKDFISCYLAQIIKATDDPVSTFNEDNLIQVVVGLFLGGTDTTGTTLYWVLIYMIQHGAIQVKGANQDGGEAGLQHRPGTHVELPAERVQQELDTVLGTSGAICYKDHEQLPHICTLLHEAQRLSSVA